ncbi:MAG: hypothetical protein RM338_05985 [Nostoc sp. DedQUE12a]|nr:hypothetical protein [Nostoc sp. DedQUE12a]
MGQTGSVGGVGSVGGWGRNLSPFSPHTPHTSLSPHLPVPSRQSLIPCFFIYYIS